MIRKRTFLFIIATVALILVFSGIINIHLDLRLLALTPKILKYRRLIQKYAVKEHLDARLICALIVQESGFDEKAESTAGAQGLTQLMPATAKDLGVEDPLNAEQNIAGAAQHLHTLFHAFPESYREHRYRLVLASYNSGLGRVRDAQATRPLPRGKPGSVGACACRAQPTDETTCRYASRSVGKRRASPRLF